MEPIRKQMLVTRDGFSRSRTSLCLAVSSVLGSNEIAKARINLASLKAASRHSVAHHVFLLQTDT